MDAFKYNKYAFPYYSTICDSFVFSDVKNLLVVAHENIKNYKMLI